MKKEGKMEKYGYDLPEKSSDEGKSVSGMRSRNVLCKESSSR